MIRRRRALPTVVAVTVAMPLTAPSGQAAAPTKPKSGVDAARQVAFTVAGRSVDLVLRPSSGSANPLAAQLAGQGVVLACKGTPPGRHRPALGVIETNWPTADPTFFRVQLSRDVSTSMQWCVLEQPDGKDIAVARRLRVPKPVTPQAPDGSPATPTPTPAPTTP
ncbi:MAG: hypothetical protein PGN13_02115 [Patulibacter minatonensis]